MDLYSCKVRLSGSLYNEVPKIKVTVPEIFVLRHIHGLTDSESGTVDNAVVTEIKRVGTTNRTDDQERARLAAVYGPALKGQGTSINALFGVGAPLPRVCEGMEGPVAKVEPDELKVKRGRPAKAKAEDETGDELVDLAG